MWWMHFVYVYKNRIIRPVDCSKKGRIEDEGG
jgi:hypothetical protein